MTTEFKDTEFNAKVHFCSKCPFVSFCPKVVRRHNSSPICPESNIVSRDMIVQHFDQETEGDKCVTLHQCVSCSYTTQTIQSMYVHLTKKRCRDSKYISAKRSVLFSSDDIKSDHNNTKSFVYMRVHRDTGYYYIGSTQFTVLHRHSADVSAAKTTMRRSSNMFLFIREMLSREGDPIEEFDLITLGEYETKQEALDVETNMIDMYYNDKGDRDSKLMLNEIIYKTVYKTTNELNTNLIKLLPQFKIYLDEYKGRGSVKTIRNLMNISRTKYYQLLKMSGEIVS